MAESWIKDKEHEFKDMTRLQVLRSLSNLDSDNLQAVADQICVSIEDMQNITSLEKFEMATKEPMLKTLSLQSSGFCCQNN
jgi:hypothetical protein